MTRDSAQTTDQPAFGLSQDDLRRRGNSKWNRYGPEVIPAWIADMDCEVAPAVQAALTRLIDRHDYGYPLRGGARADLAVSRAFSDRMERLYGWKTDPADTQALADLVQATFAAIIAFSEPGEGVILHLPAYGPFHEAIHTTGRRLVPWQMRDSGTAWDGNVDGLEGLIDPGCRILVLCNPQNPTGHVFTRAELEEIARIAIRHDLVVISDEIHCDIVFDGRRHLPIASLSAQICARSITLNSATKSFNIPGSRCAVMHFGSAQLMERFFARIPRRLLGAPSSFGIDATVAAWNDGDAWLAEIVNHLQQMRDLVIDRLARELPQIRVNCPEATYMAWLDCSALRLDMSAAEFFLHEARVAFNPGEGFDPTRADHCRINFATSRGILEQILDRMATAVAARQVAVS